MSSDTNPTNQPQEKEATTIQMESNNDKPETNNQEEENQQSNDIVNQGSSEEQPETVKPIKKGKTAKEFKKLTDEWMKNCVRTVSLPTLLEILEPIVPDMIDELKECHSQGQEYMMLEFKRLLGNLFEERHLVEKQNQLDRLIKEAQGRERVVGHFVPTPSQVTTAVLYNEKKKELYRLKNQLESITKDNYEMMNKIKREELQVEKKQSKLDSLIKDFNKNVSLGTSLSQDHLLDVMEEYNYRFTPEI